MNASDRWYMSTTTRLRFHLLDERLENAGGGLFWAKTACGRRLKFYPDRKCSGGSPAHREAMCNPCKAARVRRREKAGA